MRLGFLVVAVAVGSAVGLGQEPAKLHVDLAKSLGAIRALHGGNNGPVGLGETVDVSRYHTELALPFTRLHDCNWPCGNVVDVPAIFADPGADPGRPESYDFRRTDDYIQPIVNVGSKIVYRLGVSIEHTKRKYRTSPPADFDKWAAVCVGIIRHYNEGWAGGFRHDIRYWEIWCEPDIGPSLWSGTPEQYYRLYTTAAKAIKARFPDVKVGGPSAGSLHGLLDGRPPAFVLGFLDHCRKESAPLDFFSWHRYTRAPHTFAQYGLRVRKLLDERGFEKTQSHLNEWNYLPNDDWGPIGLAGQGQSRRKAYEQMGGPPGAAFVASALLFLQEGKVDVANYFTADAQGFGLFDYCGSPKKTFYAMKAFGQLLQTPRRVESGGDRPETGLAIGAGLSEDGHSGSILVSNFEDRRGKAMVRLANIPWKSPTAFEVWAVDAEHDLEKVQSGVLRAGEETIPIDLKPASVWLIRLSIRG